MTPRARPRASVLAAVGLLVCSALAALFWHLGTSGLESLRKYGDPVTLRVEQELFTAADFDEMQRREALSSSPVPFALWQQKNHQTAKNPLNSQEVGVSVLLVRGDSRLVLPVSTVLAEGDRTGCLLDEATAVELFGTPQVEGAQLLYGDREYTVRGLFAAPKGTLLLQLPPASDEALSCITMAWEEDVDAFQMRHGIDRALVVGNGLYLRLGGALCSLPLVAVILMVMTWLLRAVRVQKAYPIRRWLAGLLLLALFTWSFLLLLQRMPPSWVPTRWSDFDFWAQTAEAVGTQAVEIFAMQKLRPDLLQLRLVGKCLSSLLCVICIVRGKQFFLAFWADASKMDTVNSNKDIEVPTLPVATEQ